MNTQANNFMPLDEEERLISESFEAGEWQAVELTDAEKIPYDRCQANLEVSQKETN